MAIIIIIITTTTPPLAVGSDQLAGQARVEEHQQGERAEVDDQTVEDVLVDDLVAHTHSAEISERSTVHSTSTATELTVTSCFSDLLLDL